MPVGEVETPRRRHDLFSVIELIPESCIARLDPQKIFGRAAPLHVDLGCGDGAFLFALATRMPEKNFLGIERLASRVEKACRKAARIDNMRVLRMESFYCRQVFAARTIGGSFPSALSRSLAEAKASPAPNYDGRFLKDDLGGTGRERNFADRDRSP